MITLPELAAEALGSFLASDMKDRFGTSHARFAELIPFAARLALECIGNSDALYHDVEHTTHPQRQLRALWRPSRRCTGPPTSYIRHDRQKHTRNRATFRQLLRCTPWLPLAGPRGS